MFKTPEYYLYDLDTCVLEGFRLAGDLYQPIAATPQGRLPSEQLGVELGLWPGSRHGQNTTWARLFYPDGRLVPTEAEAARQLTEAAEALTAAAEAELARLRARLGEG